MQRLFVNLSASGIVLAATAAAASAQSRGSRWRTWLDNWSGGWTRGDGGTPSSSAPEIDAGSGLLALAVIGAALLLAYEIKRRRKAS